MNPCTSLITTYTTQNPTLTDDIEPWVGLEPDRARADVNTLNLHVLNAMGIDGEGTRDIISEEFEKRGHGYRINPESKETLERIHSMGLKIGLLLIVLQNLGNRARATILPI